jgi:hypothetical protein
VGTLELGIILAAVLIVGPLVWALVRRVDGFAPWARSRELQAHLAGRRVEADSAGAPSPQAVSGGG